jgi:hypothetical protein
MSRPTPLKDADRERLRQAYGSHQKRCPCCLRAEDCDTGAAILTAIATTDSGSDLPGFQGA